jgi:K+-sensing histidine kinase KdpD
MDTYYAPAELASQEKLNEEVEIYNQSAIMEGLMETVGGLLAVLNENRQIIALNDSFLKMLGIEDPIHALGLKSGQALNCIHADEGPAGCGTTKYCSTCGAAKSIMASLDQNKAVEDTCILTTMNHGRENDIVLKVRSHPVVINNTRFILLFLRDITMEQQRAALERTFFHDINNMLSGLVGASEILARESSKSPMVDVVRRSSLRLQKAVEIQKFMLACETDSYQLIPQPLSLQQLEEDLLALFANHPARESKYLKISHELGDLQIQTDVSLFQRILANMITNALEASEAGGTVKVTFHKKEETINFSVHNDQVIPEEIKLRIFQRNFSTKASSGRGIGTFSMRLFGEKILGGKIHFISTPETGTFFTFSLPLNQANLVNQYS